MMKTSIICIIVALFASQTLAQQLQCEHRKPDIPTSWIDMVSPCISKMRSQIEKEIQASMQYLAMAAHFSKDTINRPGFAHMFFESASEERQHAIKLISYLLMRGDLTKDVSNLVKKFYEPKKLAWANGADALRDALNLEAQVTKSIRDVIKTCEDEPSYNDYHLVDYLTGDFLEEQYKGQRDIAGKLSNLDKMMDKHGALGEFLFDKKLLN